MKHFKFILAILLSVLGLAALYLLLDTYVEPGVLSNQHNEFVLEQVNEETKDIATWAFVIGIVIYFSTIPFLRNAFGKKKKSLSKIMFYFSTVFMAVAMIGMYL